jgi:hypothetical protein
LHIDPYDSTISETEEVASELGDDDVIEVAKNKKVNNWWKDIFSSLPEWLMDENDEDFKD